MRRKPFARVAALALGVGLAVGAGSARAIELELPGERRLDIHGFYELRVKEFGEDTPNAGLYSLSQFRHVVSIETELGIFPEGIGPFDTMMSFTRWTISYECIYSRTCGLFQSSDSYGEHRTPIREPDHFKHARARPPFAGGQYPLEFFPGTNVPTRQRLTPGQRYKECLNPDGIFHNPFPLSAFCNLFTRTDLDQPIDLYLPGFTRTRGGFVHQQLTVQLLRAARANLGDTEFQRLTALTPLDPPSALPFNNAIARGYLAEIARAEAAGDQARVTALQGVLDNFSMGLTGVPYAQTQNAAFNETLLVRSDPDRFAPLDIANKAQIGNTLWGASQYTDTIVPWLTNIGFDVRPWGYFTNEGFDSVNQSAIGLAENFTGIDRVLGQIEQAQGVDQIPFFLGPDGVRNSPDDLPIVQCPDANGNPTPPGPDGRCTGGATSADNEPLYYVLPAPVGGWTRQACDDVVPADLATGPAGGLNANGECVILSTNGAVFGGTPVTGSGVASLAALDKLLDPRFRPATAFVDPAAVTDLKLRASGAKIPARPAAPDGGLVYPTTGLYKLNASSHNLVSNLDVDFTEDELKWEHGAGQDEHEFSEGYLEFEMLDSQLFARAGKLITVWGKTELFRNQDRINPVDIGLGTLSRLEESRLGQWAVQTIVSPEMFMRVGPFEDLRLELVAVFDQFEPTDLGECGEGQTFELVCNKTFGAIAAGLTGIGVVGEDRPDENWNGVAAIDFGARIEGRLDRFTFSISDFWGWDDGLLLDVVHQYGRRVDPETGAPVNSLGPLSCVARNGGPDGDPATTSDNLTPSEGNCLLFDNPAAPLPDPQNPGQLLCDIRGALVPFTPPAGGDGLCPQILRGDDAIALNHYANQTLFHTICSLTFDEDTGQCAVDILNEFTLFTAISSALGGGALITGLAVDGYQFVRPAPADPNDPFDTVHLTELGNNVFATVFGDLPDPNNPITFNTEAISVAATPQQQALLGCGDAYLTPCDETAAGRLRNDPTYQATVNLLRPELLRGGVDFMNADASVLTQEFTILKALTPGALVGTRPDGLGLRFEAGISGAQDSTGLSGQLPAGIPYILPAEAAALGVAGWQTVRDRISLDRFGVPFSALTNPADRLRTATDYNIEPTKWVLDTDALAMGALTFLDPRGANGVWDNGTGDDVFNPLGEDCTGIFSGGSPDPGCTALEVISANIERLTMAGEIIGGDRVFDPPETVTELLAMLDNNPVNDIDGDPIAGADGIRFNNFDGNGDGLVDDVISENGDQKVSIASANQVVVASFRDCVRGTVTGGPIGTGGRECYLNLDPDPVPVTNGIAASRDSFGRLVATLPVGLRLTYRNADGSLVSPSPIASQQSAVFPLQRLSRLQMNDLIVRGTVTDVSRDLFTAEELVDLSTALGGATIPQTFTLTAAPGVTLADVFFNPQSGYDVDANAARDFDEDNDRALDFLDDGLAGPVSDDNILCGSGIPGDVLQTAAQTEFDAFQRTQFAQQFPDGLPPRSPLFCRGATGLLGVSGFTLPTVRAGGDGRFGRRDFLWHGGRQVAIDYQKVNVLGFSLDFAEDVTKTSWGIEFSASSDKLIPNVDDFSGYSTSNDYVLSISVDRPTFFNFLNPNRSFFVNFQFFLRYLDDYKGGHGGSDSKDGNFPAAIGPISGLVTLTMFTGYFQDRLNPRFTLVFDPTTSTGGLITGLGYRFTESFSTAFSVNHFFGHHVQNRAATYPIALYSNNDFTSDGFRGLAPVTNRDEIGWVVRYSF